MTIPFPFEPCLIFSTLAIFLLIGVILRANLPFFQKFLFPSCLIGGILGLILQSTGVIDLVFHLEPADLKTFAFHFFNISFISIGLTPRDSGKGTLSPGKEFVHGPLWMALIESITLPLQAIIGGLFVLLFGAIGIKLFPTFGFLAPLGFTEGPGQALSIGKTWQGFGFEHAATIGLTFATVGFLFAFFVGVPLVNWGIRKGHTNYGPKKLSQDILTGIVPKTLKKEPAGELTMHSGNIETLAFQAALIGLVYAITYIFLILLGKFIPPMEASMAWGFFFFFGMLFAIFLRVILSKIGLDHLINPGIQRRITGLGLDFLIVSMVMAIELKIVWDFIIPISTISLTCGILTTVVVIYFGRRIGSYNFERTAAIFGTVTGTVQSGLLLLRIVDPEFKTPAAIDLALMNVVVSPVLLGLMILVSAPIKGWSLIVTIAIFASVMILAAIAMWLLKLWGEPKF